ncbi:glycosyl transferase family protein [mine drainage metagenome]|uniref:Glycosyl transferase family protein n=1 Tax=mine drainage metagenome TaxID=410659 RepID=T1CAA7_9ZZZZ
MYYDNLTIIVPTLNEGDNIGVLISELKSRYRRAKIIVADDNSTDSTKSAVLAMKRKYMGITFFDRRKKRNHGLTASVVDAASHVHTKYIVVMDGDLQHPPDVVKQIYGALQENDIVVGVRKRVKGWGFYRMLLSKGITIITIFIFLLRRKKIVSDPMSGFFGVRTAIFDKVIRDNKDGFVPGGYKVLLDLLRMVGPSVSIAEVGYNTFHARRYGRSKLRIRHMVDVLRSALR